MDSGYVLKFTNRTFQEFVADCVQLDINNEKYSYSTGSKANRLRKFWEIEPNHVVGKVVRDLIVLAQEESSEREDSNLLEESRRIAERPLQGAPVGEFEKIRQDLDDRDF